MELDNEISTVQNDLEETPCKKNDVNDLLLSKNDVREQVW